VAFNESIQSGELFSRRGQTDAGKGWRSTRRNYAPDNRKVPPDPLTRLNSDAALDADVDAQIAADGVAVGVMQNTLWHPDGGMVGGIIIDFTTPEWWGPATAYDVYAADTVLAATCFIRIGRIVAGQSDKGDSYELSHPFLLAGREYTFSLVPVNADGAGVDAADAVQATITLDDVGQLPPDVGTFDVAAHCCALLFTWVPVSGDNKNVTHYEIRQGATYDAGAMVARAWGWAAGRILVPAGLAPAPAFGAPDDQFHIKAVTGLGAVSDTEDSHTLTATEIASLVTPCCVKGREILPGAGLDSVVVTSITPDAPVPPFVVAGHGAPAGGGGPAIVAWVDPSSFAAAGNLWTYTLHFSQTTVGGEAFPLTEIT